MAKKVVLWLVGAGVPSPNRITLLRDADGDGIAEVKSTFLSGLNSPFGMTLVGETLYVADTDALLRFPYSEGETKIVARPEKIADLPAGPINLHWTKNVIASVDGATLYVTVGSNSNAGEEGMENERSRAAIFEIDPATGQSRLLPPACATRTVLPGSRTAARYGRRSTSATSSAATSSRIT